MAKERANIYTIAKEAGVSPATVSRVLTNNARVSKEKREKVQSVIQKYGYTPNALAQGLSNSKTRSIGLMIADIYSPFYSAVATECEKAADKAGYLLLMLTSLGDPELEKKQLMKLYEQQVDAIIVVGGIIDRIAVDEEYVEQLNHILESTPIIATNRPVGVRNCKIHLDEGGSMDLAMDYLFSLGHEKIAIIGGRKDAKSTLEKRMRYRTMIRQRGIVYREDYVFDSIDYSNDSGYNCTKELLKNPDRPTAIVAINDFTAAGVLRAIHDEGLRVPQDISVVAFDNTYLSGALTPALTSVGANYTEFAKHLVEAAIRASENETCPEDYMVPVGISVRDSCTHVPEENI